MTIDLCFVSYNTLDLTKRSLGALNLDERDGIYQVFVQDNDSTDGSSEYLDKVLANHDIDYVIHSANVGYAFACNRLATKGTGDIIALLNSDVWMSNDDVVAAQKFFDENPDVAIMGPKQRDEQGYITHAGIFGTNKAPKHRGWKVHDPHDKLYRDVVDAVTISGSAYFIRREVWDTLSSGLQYREIYDRIARETAEILGVEPEFNYGAFIPSGMYYEETGCSYIARHNNYRLVYNGEISIGHSWHGSIKTGSKMDRLFKVSAKQFARALDELGIEHDQ